MFKIGSYKQYVDIVKSSIRRPYETNFIMTPSAIETYAGGGKLFVTENGSEHGLLFYLDLDYFYRLYFYTDMTGGLTIPSQDKPVLTHFIYSGRVKLSELMTAVAENNGFQRYNELRQYHADSDALVMHEQSTFDGYRTDYAQNENIPEILYMLGGTFKDYIELPDEPQLIRLIEEKKAFCLFSPAGKPAGYCQLDITNGVCVMQHITITPEDRGKGLGKKLAHDSFLKSGVKSFRSWIDSDNVSSQKTHLSLGFAVNDKRMLRFIQNKTF